MSHISLGSEGADSKKINDLYYAYYFLFDEISFRLHEIANQKFVALLGDLNHKNSVSPTRETRTERDGLLKKFLRQFIYHSNLGLYGLTIGSKISSSAGAMRPYQTHDSSESMATLNGVVASVSFALNYQSVKKRRSFLLENGLMLSDDLAKTKILHEALTKSRSDLILSMIGGVGTALSVLPDPTFVTKVVAAILFIGMNLYGVYSELKSAHETLPMIHKIQEIKYYENLKDHDPSLTAERTKIFTYQAFVDDMIEREMKGEAQRKSQSGNPDTLEWIGLAKIFLAIGNQLKESGVDLVGTALTRQEWLELAEKALVFKRKLHFFNALRGMISGMVSGLAMGVGAIVTLININALASRISLPSIISSVLLTASKLIQNFVIQPFFKKTVLDTLSFRNKICLSVSVFTAPEIKNLKSQTMAVARQKLLTEEGVDLSKTLALVISLKTGDSVLRKYPELNGLLESLKRADRDHLKIEILRKIGKTMRSIPVLTSVEVALAKKLLATTDITEKEKNLSYGLLDKLMSQSLEDLDFSDAKLREHIRDLKHKIHLLSSGATTVSGLSVEFDLFKIRGLLSPPQAPRRAILGVTAPAPSSDFLASTDCDG
jgi:hypothetical protein